MTTCTGTVTCPCACHSSDYWEQAMHRRMPKHDEVTRLLTVLRGFYLAQGPAHVSTDKPLIDFATNSDRPYGTKDISESIAFNLGWDHERRLTHSRIPDWVRAYAAELHAMVIDRLRNDPNMYFNNHNY